MSEPHSVFALAYLGDAVFELCVRDMLVNSGDLSLNGYNKLAREYVSAVRQSVMYRRIFPHLTEDEQSVIKRGRNLHTPSHAKNAPVTDYRHATGLETLFGHLYITEQHERLKEIFKMCIMEETGEDNGKQEQ